MIDTLLKMSVMGSVVIGIVLLLRLFLRRAPKIFSYVQVVIVGVLVVALAAIALGADAMDDTVDRGQTHGIDNRTEENNPLPVDTQQIDASEQDTPKDSAVIETLSVRTISRSARCIDNYVIPDNDWEKDYGSELAFAENCNYYINSSRTTMDAKGVSFSKFADAINTGDPIVNKPCIVKIHNDDKLIYEITLISEHYPYGVSYATIPNGDFSTGSNEDSMVIYPAFYGSSEPVRAEHMDIATTPGEETIAIYSGVADGSSHGDVFIRDTGGNLLYHYTVSDSGMCWQNLYAGRMDGAGEPYLLELNLENRDTSGEYSFYVYSLGVEKGELMQIAGSRIEWNKNGNLIYDADEMVMFFHELGHYLYNSHLLVGVENQQIRTEPVCDEDHYTYANLVPKCFIDPYAGMDVR